MNKTLVLLASILIATTPLAGCIDGDTLEEIIDDVVGCMDTEAKNYDENATTELVGNCIYAASKEAFMDAMNQEIDLQSMLNQSTTAGYSMSMTAPMGDELGDMGDDMMVLIEETVMVNMSANAAHVSIAMSIPMLFSSITTMTQVGGVVNVHHKLDGMLVSEMGAETVDEKYQTRDMVPDVMDWVIPMLADSMASEMVGDSEDTEDDLIDDDWDMDSATISVSFDSETNSQTMDLSTAMDNGSTMNLSVKIDENSELHISDLSRDRCSISLFQRPYLTVPYLGRGKSDAILESQLQQGELANNRKSINPSTEVSYANYTQTPMIPSLKATINNPANLVEGVAAEGWIRGGLPTKQLTKDKDYATQHTNKQYV